MILIGREHWASFGLASRKKNVTGNMYIEYAKNSVAYRNWVFARWQTRMLSKVSILLLSRGELKDLNLGCAFKFVQPSRSIRSLQTTSTTKRPA